MKTFWFYILKILICPILWFVTLALVFCIIRLPMAFANPNLAWGCLIGFLIGLPLFFKYRCVPIYVFGHELTHWAVATLFWRKTSNLRLNRYSGSVDVKNPNIWIILGPYFLPFYMLVILGIFGIALIFKPNFPTWFEITLAVVIGLSYAYHIILTIVAIYNGQQDLRINGVIFSLSIIIVCNVFYIYIGLMLATQQLWPGLKLLATQINDQSRIFWQMCMNLYSLSKSSQ